MTEKEVVCENCGSTDFFLESGLYYCSECQVQSQEIREHHKDNEVEENQKVKSSRKGDSDEKSAKTNNVITSWECYNYILLGLTEELINLGANKNLKLAVKILWLTYLEKLQVFKRGRDNLPKLQAVNSAVDAEVIYGKLAKRKRKRSNKSSSDEADVTSLESSSCNRERGKKKRAIAQAQYEEFTQKSQGTTSLHNETLTSLQSGSESSKKNGIVYNFYASRELRKKQSRYHLSKHRNDFDRMMKCHQLSYRNMSHAYQASPHVLSINKLYVVLYFALLITKEKFQLGDLFRFIKEGHLSYNCYSHFFSDEFDDKILNFKNFKKANMFSNRTFRTYTMDMAKFLQFDWYVVVPNLIELCERYCRDLNLPKEICDCAKNIISRTKIHMSFRKSKFQVPNYEGRVLSIILFVLKLLFGLDDVTEFELGKFANLLNNNASEIKFFDIIEWLKFIEYRDLVLSYHHFPTGFYTGTENFETYLNFISKRQYPEDKMKREQTMFHGLLSSLNRNASGIEYEVSLTPNNDHLNKLLSEDILREACLTSVLSKDYSDHSLSHILNPNCFLKAVNTEKMPEVYNGGANENLFFEKIGNPETDSKKATKERRKPVTVKLSIYPVFGKSKTVENNKRDYNSILENFQLNNVRNFKRNAKRLERFTRNVHPLEQKKKELRNNLQPYLKHYNPYERYWLRCHWRIERLSRKDFLNYFRKFPSNFKIIFKEFQKISQQTEQDLLEEFQNTEIYLIFCTDYYLPKLKVDQIQFDWLTKFIKKSERLW